MQEKLKPCPFCGGEARLISLHNCFGLSGVRWIVECIKCGCKTSKEISDHDAKEKWNRRENDDG